MVPGSSLSETSPTKNDPPPDFQVCVFPQSGSRTNDEFLNMVERCKFLQVLTFWLGDFCKNVIPGSVRYQKTDCQDIILLKNPSDNPEIINLTENDGKLPPCFKF
ncbi:hypothetical protein GOP47_0000180 [Adiantum capillus-veneris]|uniref:Uncharacterized protein n=1 Tax=Adiantum capillus-veneris TaxID=13818 RepID=A0A9D4ZS56_ADICA|nr:hypothetical protein GOP47_0000180 [Adiantum capillus-veneris]